MTDRLEPKLCNVKFY